MTCRKCQHSEFKKSGRNRNETQRYKCRNCRTTFSESRPAVGSHYKPVEEIERILLMMLEGMSVRSIERITGIQKRTILSLMVTASQNAVRVFDALVRNIRPKFVQLDELWAMIGCHGKNVTVDSPADWGDAWTWLALDSESKMILSYHIGPRNTVSAFKFVHDLRERTLGTYQITSDALRGYIGAVEEWYGSDVHFSQLQKIYGRTEAGPEWYGGGRVIAAVAKVKTGSPDWAHISTSHIERCNLSVRMHNRRYARKTNAISKKLANLKAAIALWVVWYNFCRVHSSLRVTPSMEAGITDHVWSLAELLGAA
jgi:transposase-like protein/IS1 family transposase